jgi:membrane associated rhomboid family serine protease
MIIVLPLRADASWRHQPTGTIAVMLTLLLLHIFWTRNDPANVEPYLLNFQQFDVVQWLTSGLLHADWFHLIGNLIFLYVFGSIIEDYLGRWFVPGYILLTMLSGGMEQIITLLNHDEGSALGASSAIYGLIAMAMLWAPRTHISTFFWVMFTRPYVLRVRVFWIAGWYMVMQIITVLIDEGRPSSEFLHACGIVVGIVIGVTCLYKKWVDTMGEDLLKIGTPRTKREPLIPPPQVTVSEQNTRLSKAVEANDYRVALAAYEVLRREHPSYLPTMSVLERLVEMCEKALDFHRAAAIAERGLVAESVSPYLRFLYARVMGSHLGHGEKGLAQLSLIQAGDIPPEAQRDVDELRDRLTRRERASAITTRRVQRSILFFLFIGIAQHSYALEQEPVLPFFALDKFPEQVEFPEGVTIKIPKKLLYLAWADVEKLLLFPAEQASHPAPRGLIMSFEQYDELLAERDRAPSRWAWEQRSSEFVTFDNPIEVSWEPGWVDTSESLPESTQLLSWLQIQADVINRKQLMGPVSVQYSDWGDKPMFDVNRGMLKWSLHLSMNNAGMHMGGLPMEVMHRVHLGATGSVHLLCVNAAMSRATKERINMTDLINQVSDGVSWTRAAQFTTSRPSGVGERVGGLRMLIQPRLFFGNAPEELDYHRGLGYAWILIIAPLLVVGFLLLRWIMNIVGAAKPAKLSDIPHVMNGCPACGKATSPGASRCFSCGTTLIR